MKMIYAFLLGGLWAGGTLAWAQSVTAQGDTVAQVELRLQVNLVSSAEVTMNRTEVAPGAWRLVTTGFVTGVADAKRVEQTFLVLDDGPKPMLSIAYVGDHIEVSRTSEVTVIVWPGDGPARDMIALHKRWSPHAVD